MKDAKEKREKSWTRWIIQHPGKAHKYSLHPRELHPGYKPADNGNQPSSGIYQKELARSYNPV